MSRFSSVQNLLETFWKHERDMLRWLLAQKTLAPSRPRSCLVWFQSSRWWPRSRFKGRSFESFGLNERDVSIRFLWKFLICLICFRRENWDIFFLNLKKGCSLASDVEDEELTTCSLMLVWTQCTHHRYLWYSCHTDLSLEKQREIKRAYLQYHRFVEKPGEEGG